ncbi:MAG: polysaccharide deacetylase family protein [Lachnospiraceae bacterium]|nr:polysaccharide deacetylase family protein [Lachnospiraceae bacterium]
MRRLLRSFHLGMVLALCSLLLGDRIGDFASVEVSSPEIQGSAKTIALTFDDGPHKIWTPVLLDGLKERGVKVTFFLMGENIPGNEEIVKRMQSEGHLIGNHSYRHIQLTRAGMEETCQAFERTGQMIEELTGTRPQYVRPPYGDWNEELECRTNLTTVLWNVDSMDWSYQNRNRIVSKVCREVEDGDIILMHDIFQSSQEAALDIIDCLLAEGWQFVTVDELVVD